MQPSARPPTPAGLPPRPPDTRELARRLALCTPEDATRGMFFNGVLRAVEIDGGKAALDRCLAAAGRREFVDLFNYPVGGFLRMAWEAAGLLGPLWGPPEQVFRRLGRQAVVDFLGSAVGRTLLTLAGNNPRQLCVSVPGAYRAAVSYGERSVEWLGDKRCRITFKRDLMDPAYHAGVLQAAVEAFGGVGARCEHRVTGPLDSEYDVSWT